MDQPSRHSLAYLGSWTVFSDLSAAEFVAVARRLEWFRLAEEEALFSAGDPGDRLYFVVHGRLAVQGPNGEIVGFAGPGESIGELALLAGETRTASVVASRESVVASLSRGGYQELAREVPSALGALNQLLAAKIRTILRPRETATTAVEILLLIPLGDGVPLAGLARDLVARLAAYGPVLHLDAAAAAAAPGDGGTGDPERQGEWLAWLNEQETRHRFVVLEGDPGPSPWLERCLASADRLLLVARADADGIDPAVAASVARRALRPQHLILLRSGDGPPRGTARWLDRFPRALHHHLRPGDGADLARLARYFSRRSLSLALSGGAAFTFAQIGVLKALAEAGYAVDLFCGSSMGAVIAAQGGLGLGWEAIRDNMGRHFRDRSIFDYTLPIVSMCRGRRLERGLEAIVGERQIEDLPLPFFCISTNLTRSRGEVHRRGSLRAALRATMAMAGVFPPLISGGDVLCDGLLANNLPADVARRIAPGPSIAVNVIPTSDRVTRARLGSLSPWRTLYARLTRRGEDKPPVVTDYFFRCAMMGAILRAEEGRHEADLYIEPDLSRWNFLNSRALDELIEAGYRAAAEKLEGWTPPGGIGQ